MSKKKQTQIIVTTVFDGKQDGLQAFIELILKRQQDKLKLEPKSSMGYTYSKVFSDVYV